MSRDPRDPAYDERRYCERCLGLLTEDWLREHDSDEWPECPRCKRSLDHVLTFDQMRIERAIERANGQRDRDKDEGKARP